MDKRKFSLIDRLAYNGANKLVKAWNWTTGREKEELANHLLSVYTIGSSLALTIVNPIIGIATFPPNLWLSHRAQKTNSQVGKIEREYAEQNLKFLPIEELKEMRLKLGHVDSAFALMNIPLPFAFNDPELSYAFTFFGGAWAGFALSNYVMVADTLPPRKDVLLRAKDKLVEMLKNYQAKRQPLPNPSPAMNCLSYREMEKYLQTSAQPHISQA